MASQLLQVLAFSNVTANSQATLSHNLNINGVAVLPDYVDKDNGSFSIISVTTTQVVVQNNATGTASCNIWLERKHSVIREIGAAQNLTPQPFVPADVPAQISGDIALDRITNKYWPTNSEIIRYIRSSTGSDSNDGLTPATAWQTLTKGLQWLSLASMDQTQILDVAGTFSFSHQLNLGGVNLGGINNTFDPSATGPNNFASRSMCQIRSALVSVVANINITAAVPNATSGLYTSVTVSNALTAGANKGQFLVGSGLGEWAVIQSTASTRCRLPRRPTRRLGRRRSASTPTAPPSSRATRSMPSPTRVTCARSATGRSAASGSSRRATPRPPRSTRPASHRSTFSSVT